ncbi:hypothetical protein J4218_04700 [Candidatus Pacearchaeota archaeon]|nr:hypothetical protein [Candidatus Pacearchaeota archaeon]
MFQKFCLKKIDHTPFFDDTEAVSDPKYASALSRATGDIVTPRVFTEDTRGSSIDMSKVEFHAIYNPRTNWTHYFALPRKGL